MSDTEKPLVTFALFAYNQEKYIREAVEGAFSQDYSPLEIILSDDCSTDATFEIMREMAECYSGPHIVKVVKNPVNQGLFKHVMKVADEAAGELIVMAAGDDISNPNRVKLLVKSWRATRAWAFYSRFNRINEEGYAVSEGQLLMMPDHVMRRYWADGGKMALIHGATSAYVKNTFKLLYGYVPEVMTEDGVMCALLHFHNKPIHFVEDSLVQYRENPQALSNAGSQAKMGFLDIIQSEHKSSKMALYFKNFNVWLLSYKMKLDVGMNENSAVTGFEEKAVIDDLALYSMMNTWIEHSTFFQRTAFLFKHPRAMNWRWMIPRLFGLNVFAFIKSILRK